MSQSASSPPVTQRIGPSLVALQRAGVSATPSLSLLQAPSSFSNNPPILSPLSTLQLPTGGACFRLLTPQVCPPRLPTPTTTLAFQPSPIATTTLPTGHIHFPASAAPPATTTTTTLLPRHVSAGNVMCPPAAVPRCFSGALVSPRSVSTQLVYTTSAPTIAPPTVPASFPTVCSGATSCPHPVAQCPACHLPLPPSASISITPLPPALSPAVLHTALPMASAEPAASTAAPVVAPEPQPPLKYTLIHNDGTYFTFPAAVPPAMESASPAGPSPWATPHLPQVGTGGACPFPSPSAPEVTGIPLQFIDGPFPQPAAVGVPNGEVSGQFQAFGIFSGPESLPSSPTTVPEFQFKGCDKTTSVSGMDLLTQQLSVPAPPEPEMNEKALALSPMEGRRSPEERWIKVEDSPQIPSKVLEEVPSEVALGMLTPEKPSEGAALEPQVSTELPATVEAEMPVTPIKPAELFIAETPISPEEKAAQEIAVVVASIAAESPAQGTASPAKTATSLAEGSTIGASSPTTKTRKKVRRVVKVTSRAKASPKRSPKRSPKASPKPMARPAAHARPVVRQAVRARQSPTKERVSGASVTTHTPLLGVDVHTQLRRIVEGGNAVQDNFLCARAVVHDGPFHQAGIRAGDVIVAWGSEKLTSQGQWVQKVSTVKPGDVVHLTVFTGEDCQEVPVVVGASGRTGRHSTPPATAVAPTKSKAKAAKKAPEVPRDDSIQGW
eukprot:GGOE01003723.1.p1 GENE.GGOE01003723.1~~GGOE01003723.1.p1  ORF type:complete len:735 (+),score=143.12 GGOE01003723.1:35-2206(+)